jgi:acyl-CoA thioesterase-1
MFRLFAALVAALAPLTAAGSGASAGPVTIVALGDSLTAGYQLAPGKGFPAQLEAALRAEGLDVTVVDAGVSGDTTAGGLARLDWSVGPEANAVIVELGGNDALRGIDPAATRANLAAILDRLAERNLPVLLAGMLAPPNMGPEYGAAFKAVFDDLARRDVLYYPFFLDGVAAVPELGLGDGIHPNEEGVRVIVERILPAAKALVAAAEARRDD